MQIHKFDDAEVCADDVHNSKKMVLACSLGIIVICLLCYYNAFSGDFVFDDSFAIVNNRDVIGNNSHSLWFHDYWGQNLSRSDSHKSYRPITTLTFRANFLISVSNILQKSFIARVNR